MFIMFKLKELQVMLKHSFNQNYPNILNLSYHMELEIFMGKTYMIFFKLEVHQDINKMQDYLFYKIIIFKLLKVI